MTHADIEKIFTYHAPKNGEQVKAFEELRGKAKELAHLINTQCPDSREKSLSLTNLQQVIMWANASIAIHD